MKVKPKRILPQSARGKIEDYYDTFNDRIVIREKAIDKYIYEINCSIERQIKERREFFALGVSMGISFVAVVAAITTLCLKL